MNLTGLFSTLNKAYPEAGALEVGPPFVRLVAIMLSARTKDEQVLKLLPRFFAQFPTPQTLAKAPLGKIEQSLSTIGLFRAKAKSVKKMAGQIAQNFNGLVPRTVEQLVTLAGVGRKTASVLVASTFRTPAVAVDVHVARIAVRLGLATGKTPEIIEKSLQKNIPKKFWTSVNRTFVPLGREYCTPTKPRCYDCPLRDLCPYPHKNLDVPKNAGIIAQRRRFQRQQLIKLSCATLEKLHHSTRK